MRNSPSWAHFCVWAALAGFIVGPIVLFGVYQNRPATQPPAAPATISALERDIADGINQARLAQGLPALIVIPALSDVARGHSYRMGVDGFRGHIDRQGRGAAERLAEAGIPFVGVGENVARGTISSGRVASVLISGWMNSPEHRANILEPRFTETGVGLYFDGARYYCTQVFILPR